MCIYYIYPKLALINYRLRSGKGAGRFRGSIEGAPTEQPALGPCTLAIVAQFCVSPKATA